MRNDLKFIAMIDAAFDAPDQQAALRWAFVQIRRMKHDRRYRRGYRQFVHWMQHAASARLQAEARGTLGQAPEMLDRPARIELIIERDGALLASLPLEPRGGTGVGGIVPGSYRFRLDTGNVLWDGSVSRQGEFVERPEPGQPLRMAAATKEPLAAPRNEIRLLDGTLVFRLRSDGPAWLLEVESASLEA